MTQFLFKDQGYRYTFLNMAHKLFLKNELK